MADSARNINVMAIIPRNWRLLTVAGVTTVGLACGVGTPALAQLWNHSRSNEKTSESRPADSGFNATIRKLKADSRRAAEQGDQAKAIQLAERAAKISEAAAQVVGPTGECSPGETARFLADTRARRTPATGIASQPVSKPATRPSLPALQQSPAAATSPNIAAAPKPKVTNPPQIAKAPVAPQVKLSAPQLASTAKVAPPKQTPAVAVAKTTSPTSASRSAGMSFRQEPIASPEVAASDPSPQAAPVRSTPQSKSAESVDDLLVQSRLEAATGNTDLALRLADQAVAASGPSSFFGQGAKASKSADAVRWREQLLVRQQAGIVTVASGKSTVPVGSKPQVDAPSKKAKQAPIETAAVQFAAAKVDWEVDPAAPASTAWADASESLPPAPSPQVRRNHEPVQFHRSTIARQGEWVEAESAESMDSNRTRAANDAAQFEWTEVHPAQTPVIQAAVATEDDGSVPEFVITESSAAVTTEEATSAESDPTIPGVMFDVQVSPIPTESSDRAANLERPPLKLRGAIQQVGAKFPADSSPAKRQAQVAPVLADRVVTTPPAKKSIEPKPKAARGVPAVNVDSAKIEENAAAENPVQRFPVQKVLQLRQRIESATAFDPGASTSPVSSSPTTTQVPKTEDKSSARNAAEWESDVTERPDPVQKVSVEVPNGKRPALKMRERLPVVSDSTIEGATNSSKVASKTPITNRPEIIGHSSMTQWVSAGQSASSRAESSKAGINEFQQVTSDQPRIRIPDARQPVTETIVSQVDYKPSDATSGINVASIGVKEEVKQSNADQIDIAPPPPVVEEKDTWLEESLVRKRAVTSTAVQSSSFGLIDRLAFALNLPASTVVSLLGGSGLMLIGFGLVAIRASLRKRHSA